MSGIPRAVTADGVQATARAARAAADVRAAEARLVEAVADARSHNVPWANIADALGITRQSAATRFGRTSKRSGPGAYSTS